MIARGVLHATPAGAAPASPAMVAAQAPAPARAAPRRSAPTLSPVPLGEQRLAIGPSPAPEAWPQTPNLQDTQPTPAAPSP
jgi:hypothetical protein